jgi:hypothetical protein
MYICVMYVYMYNIYMYIQTQDPPVSASQVLEL